MIVCRGLFLFLTRGCVVSLLRVAPAPTARRSRSTRRWRVRSTGTSTHRSLATSSMCRSLLFPSFPFPLPPMTCLACLRNVDSERRLFVLLTPPFSLPFRCSDGLTHQGLCSRTRQRLARTTNCFTSGSTRRTSTTATCFSQRSGACCCGLWV